MKGPTIRDILSRWFEFSGYDPDQHKFNLLSSEYDYHKAGERITELLRDYEPSGALAVMYAKQKFIKSMKESRVNLWNVLSEPEKLKPYQEAYADFHSPVVMEGEQMISDNITKLIEKISGKPMLGDRDMEKEKSVIAESVETVVDNIQKLHYDVYRKGGKVELVHKFPSQIFVFPTLAQCVLSLDKAENGMYLCYITMGNTANGYFGYFIKSNGNLFSAHERPDEAYPGQHDRCRSGRWSDSKLYGIFPYENFSYGEYDYKGYSHEHKINEEKLSFADMDPENYVPIVLTMLLLANKFAGKSLDMPQTLMDSLMPVNIKQVEEKGMDLVVFQDNSLVQTLGAVDINFSKQDILSGAAGAEFDYGKNEDKPYWEKGHFPEQNGFAQMLIDMYGEGFELDMDSLMKSDSCLAMLPEKAGGAAFTPEFVGSPQRMRMEAYRQCRLQLAKYIRAKMLEEYISFGGAVAMAKWWKDAIMNRKDAIEEICCRIYRDEDVANWENPKDSHPYLSGEVVEKEWSYKRGKGVSWNGICVSVFPNTNYKIPYRSYFDSFSVATCDIDARKESASDEFGKCTVWFIISPKNWKELELLAGKDVPKIAKGWDSAPSLGAGNPILDATDAITEIEHPFYELNHRTGDPYTKTNLGHRISFNIAVGFSKRRLKRLLANI